jgi:nondiscriminating glutamyl-tRNA synthetase
MEKTDNIRVRFAPSPTGYVHVGSLRTALFNYLFARHNNGKFIIRIEDTDRSRFVEGAVENLLHYFSLLGIEHDEGPKIGGDYGPYYQSERTEIYRKHAMELIDKGFAYYSFETPEELDEIKKILQLEGKYTSYDRRGRNLSPEEVKEKLESGIPYVIRLKVPLNEEVKFDDIVKGTIKIETNSVDDQVLLKSDGFPTYHLANVVDDHLMNITHIIRGEEWITSVPKHIILYNAFGWEVPKMAHVPLILNPDKSKLSKRQGDVAVEDYLKKGYLKEALVNFMALLGWNPGEGETNEIFSMAELIERFSLERVQTAGAVFSIDKLNWMNNEYIKKYDIDELVELALPYFEDSGYDTQDKERIKAIVETVRVYLNKLSDIPDNIGIFYAEDVMIDNTEYLEALQAETTKKAFVAILAKVEAMESITPDGYKEMMKEVQKETGVKGKLLFKPVRLALTGSEHGPELPNVAAILGKGKVVKFLSKWV